MRCLLFLCLLALSSLCASEPPLECFFIPPEGWECAAPDTLSGHVKIAFFKKGKKAFCPSINLSIEETSAPLTDYLKAVRSLHERDRNNQWRLLGKVRTRSGLAQLTEIDTSSDFGPVRLLQLILLKQGYAYILTTAALKEEFSDHYKAFQTAFRSLTLTSDLVESIPQLERRESLKKAQEELLTSWQTMKALPFADNAPFQKGHWLPFQSLVLSQFGDMGPYWQALVLRAAQSELSVDTILTEE